MVNSCTATALCRSLFRDFGLNSALSLVGSIVSGLFISWLLSFLVGDFWFSLSRKMLFNWAEGWFCGHGSIRLELNVRLSEA